MLALIFISASCSVRELLSGCRLLVMLKSVDSWVVFQHEDTDDAMGHHTTK